MHETERYASCAAEADAPDAPDAIAAGSLGESRTVRAQFGGCM